MLAPIAWTTAFALAAMLGARPAAAGEEQRRPAPSFDCHQAASRVEKAICSDADLAAQDRRLSLVFAEAKRELKPHTKPLVEEQRKWLEERKECWEDETDPQYHVDCLSSRYRLRLFQLFDELPVLARLRQPVSDAEAKRVIAVFHLMTPEELYEATTDDNRDALAEASCLFFQRFPREAAELFKADDYSTRDSWRPLCRTIDVATQVPATRRLMSVLYTISGDAQERVCIHTMQYGYDRTQKVARIMAVVDATPDIDAYERERAHVYDGLSYHPDLAHWGMQGLWEKRRYADLLRALARARPALADDYARRFHLDAARASRLADYHVQRLIEVYAGTTGASSTLSYYSLCLTTADLDRYLETGRVPAKECPDGEFADPAPQATLRRLLGLAIVNGYSTKVVMRLIGDGARVDPPGPNRRNQFGKTALMYAVQERDLLGVQRLIHGGADVNAATAAGDPCVVEVQPGGRTALMYAAWQATPAIVQALVEAQANVTLTDSNGKTAAAYVDANRTLSSGERQVVKMLLREPQMARR